MSELWSLIEGPLVVLVVFGLFFALVEGEWTS